MGCTLTNSNHGSNVIPHGRFYPLGKNIRFAHLFLQSLVLFAYITSIIKFLLIFSMSFFGLTKRESQVRHFYRWSSSSENEPRCDKCEIQMSLDQLYDIMFWLIIIIYLFILFIIIIIFLIFKKINIQWDEFTWLFNGEEAWLEFSCWARTKPKKFLGLSFINTNLPNFKLYIVLDVWNKTKEKSHHKSTQNSHNFIHSQFRRSLRLHLARATSLLNHKVTQVDELSLVRVCSEYTHKVLRVASRNSAFV